MARRSLFLARTGISPWKKLLLLAAMSLVAGQCQADETAVSDPAPAAQQPESPVSPLDSVQSAEKLWQDAPLANLKATLQRTEGDLPPNIAAPRLAEAGQIHAGCGMSRPWMLTGYEWEAPSTRHLPLLFEDSNLERMGYTHRCTHGFWECETSPWTTECMQPLVSGAHFFGNIAMVPYRCGYQPACEPVYTLGVDRPGSPVCYRKHHLPLSLEGAAYQAGFVTGMVFVIP